MGKEARDKESVHIELTGHGLTLEQVARVAWDKTAAVSLSRDALPDIKASRQVVEDVLKSDKIVYSINTGFGAMSSITIPKDQVDQLQLNFVRSHAAGTGDFLDEPTVRAMLLLRANSLAKGCSGVRPELIEKLLELLNKGVYPAVPSQGSLGASGDLAPLAHLALVLIGEGEVFIEGSRVPGDQGLKQAGIEPVVLKAKEGLALVNGTQMMTAIGVLTLQKARHLIQVAEMAGAMTIEAVRGSHKPFDKRVDEVRPHPGHQLSSAYMRKLLAGSEIEISHQNCNKVQDAYSLRCIPQVHGAARDVLGFARNTLAIEINACTDNPLIFPDGTVLSQGNFHGEPVALAMDMLALALAELTSISDRRISKLTNPIFSDLPAFLVAVEGLNSGVMVAHYTASSLASENKVLAHPASVDTIPTSNDKEDHVSMGAIAARKAARILKHLRWVLATELFCAAQGLEFRQELRPGEGVFRVYKMIRKEVKPLNEDRVLVGDIEKIAAMIDDGRIFEAVQDVIGSVEDHEYYPD